MSSRVLADAENVIVEGVTAGLSAAQTEILTAQSLAENAAIYTIAQSLTLPADLNLEAFRLAVCQVVCETESLHVRFEEDGDRYVQRLNVMSEWNLDVRPDDRVTPSGIEAAIASRLDRPINLFDPTLFRLTLLRLEDGGWLFLQAFHHLVMDGYACAAFARRLADIYEARSRGAESSERQFGSFGDLLAADRHYRLSEQATRDRAYWRETLSGIEPSAPVPDLLCPVSRAQLRQTEIIVPSVALHWRMVAKDCGQAFRTFSARLRQPFLQCRASMAKASLDLQRRPDRTKGFSLSPVRSQTSLRYDHASISIERGAIT